jgi:hypothetical protein
MAVKKFVLEIDIGNDATLLPTHIASILSDVVKRIPHVIMSKGISSKIKDVNGNTIGSWSYQ